MHRGERMRAWRPRLPGVHEVLHADFVEHAYPAHTHQEWTLLLLDRGEVAHALDGAARRAPAGTVSLLPPHVAHDGRSATPAGFRKRVVYLDRDWLPDAVVGASVDRPVLPGVAPAARALHDALLRPRAFVRAYGITPHRYLVGRRVDRARHLLTTGCPPADAAIASGFYDQAHLTRHFTRVLGVTPAAYARGAA
jgi:hypothetical protein